MCQLYTGLEEGFCRTSCLRQMRKRDLTIGYTIVSISDLSSGVASMVAATKHHRYVSNFHNLLLRRGRGADYCDQFVCVSVCVCLSVREHICGTAGPIFSKFFLQIPVAVTRSCSGGVAIRYVLPVLWMTSRLAVMGRIAMCGAALR